MYLSILFNNVICIGVSSSQYLRLYWYFICFVSLLFANDPHKHHRWSFDYLRIISRVDICLSAQVGWVKADTKAIQAIHHHVITHNPRISISHTDHKTWNLHLKHIMEEDAGEYMCQINTDPMISQVGIFKTLWFWYLNVEITENFVMDSKHNVLINYFRSTFWKRYN